MDVRYINPVMAAIVRVFETMVHASIKIGKPELKSEVQVADVSGMIGLSGDVRGCVSLCFPLEVAERTASAFAGSPLHAKHPDFADAIGELANMVAGSAKSQLDGMNVSISLPNVIIGRELQVLQSRMHPQIIIPCTTDFGGFFVEIGMTVVRAPKAAMVAEGAHA